MNNKLIEKLNELISKHQVIAEQLKDEMIYQDHALLKKLNQEFSKIDPIIKKYDEYKNAIKLIEESQAFLNEKDKELRLMAEEEISVNTNIRDSLEEYLENELVDKDPNDSKDAFVEIRAGTGGEEAAIFVGDLFKMYTKFSEKNSWDIELLNVTESDHGGYKEIILKVSGVDVYGNLKFESGTHRVQRVPNTETQGRIHTSASTVAVLPAVDEIDQIDINPADLRIDTYRASGAGGQHVNKTDSAVRITHIPTGTVSECQDGRSQHKNKAQAMSILHSKILMHEQEEQRKNTAEERKNIVGSGDRSERIRTYNYPQGRITDHRINLTLYKLEQILEGNIESLIEELRKAAIN
ncbi:MAG: peptide chain release factor 1 [Gammaproteobacteria bacterium]|tara:strand:- start:278 stop:1336 length:1059 start_codon:yes stop_codon:yes gene_type:complete